MNVLIVDDQRSARRILTSIVGTMHGVNLHEASSLDEALQVLAAVSIDVALVDIRLGPDVRNQDGLELVGHIREHSQAVPVVITAFNDMAEIRVAMRRGAYDYILKDDLCEELVIPVLEEIRSRRDLEKEVLTLRARRTPERLAGIVGNSEAMVQLRANIGRVALSRRPALVTGPTGSGKELVVQALHSLGPNPEEPLLDINCGAIPESLMESLLFGHERGAFTGADRRHHGHFSAVGRGTLFLDEIAEMPLGLQVKLLRVLETGRFRSVGGPQENTFEGRVIAATHGDLEARAREGRFREDLLYRLNVLELRVPALSERRDDIPSLVSHFVAQQNRPLSFTQDALELLANMGWPGNVRQLRNLIDRVAVFATQDQVNAEVVRGLMHSANASGAEATDWAERLRQLARSLLQMPCPNKLSAIETALLEEAMSLSDGNKSAAARLLGVHRKAVERRLERGGPEDWGGSETTQHNGKEEAE